MAGEPSQKRGSAGVYKEPPKKPTVSKTNVFGTEISDENPLRMVELFAGIGASAAAMKAAGIPCETVAVSEIDRHALAAYAAVHGGVPNLGDIRDVPTLPPSDIMTYSFPCQDISVAGQMAGYSEDGEGSRSSLVWQVARWRFRQNARDLPNALVMENVPQVHRGMNAGSWRAWLARLSELGYSTTWFDLRASRFSAPQFRERCFAISTRDGRCPVVTERDGLTPFSPFVEREVADRYNLDYLPIKWAQPDVEPNDQGFAVAGVVEASEWKMYNVVYSPSGILPTLTTHADRVKLMVADGADGWSVRRLTEREAWRAMGQSDEAFDAASKAVPRSSLYRLAGNSICIPVLAEVFRSICYGRVTSTTLGMWS